MLVSIRLHEKGGQSQEVVMYIRYSDQSYSHPLAKLGLNIVFSENVLVNFL